MRLRSILVGALLMALSYAHGSFQWLTTDGVGTTKGVSGLSFQPKALFFYCMGIDGGGVDASSDTNHWNVSFGFAASTTDRRCVASHHRDANANAICGTTCRDDAVLAHTDGDGVTVLGLLDLTAIASDGFTCTVDDQLTNQHLRVFWCAWGGDDITSVVTGELTEPGATGNQDYTVAGSFQPSAVLFAFSQFAGTTPALQATNAGIGLGAAAGAASQWVFCADSDDGSGTMQTTRYGRSDECVAMVTDGNNPSVTSMRASFVQFNSDGFRLNWAERASTRKVIYLAIAGGQWAIGTYTHDMRVAGNTATVSGLAFQPQGALQASHHFSEQAAGALTSFAVLIVGSFASTSDRQGMGAIIEDGTAAGEVDIAIEYDQVLVAPNIAGSPPGVLKSADVSAINSDGFEMIADVGGSTSIDLIGYVAFADEPAAGGGAFPWQYYAQQRTA